jgi:hypothetical protein
MEIQPAPLPLLEIVGAWIVGRRSNFKGGSLRMFTMIDKTNSTEGECLYHIANALNGCAIAWAGILITFVVYVHHVW